MSNSIKIKGARQHNLKNIDVEIPRDKLVVITGLSGSGKSSLAFDTIYAEGQRRYMESLSAYARQFLDMNAKPDVDMIEGLSPAISIEQKTTSKNPRSIVGTVTEIYDYMRLLWARVGVPYSPATGLPIESQTVSQMVDIIGGYKKESRILILAPIARGKKGEYKKEFASLLKQGFQRIKVDGKVYALEEAPNLDKNIKHNISVVVDRLVVKTGIATRLAASIEAALSLSDGLLITEDVDSGEERLFSEKFACPVCGFTIEEIEPRLFSFNNPYGACPDCDGLGVRLKIDEDLVVPSKEKTIRGGAISPWSRYDMMSSYNNVLEGVSKAFKINLDVPWQELPEKHKKIILYGDDSQEITINYNSFSTKKIFEGVIPNLERRIRETDSEYIKEELAKYQTAYPCETCHGARLKPQALAVKIEGKNIAEISNLSIGPARKWFESLEKSLKGNRLEIAAKILKEIKARLGFLENVGLDYLTLSRASASLSGGEAQRIRLASQIGSGLEGVLYVLDEPSIGLHQRDNDKLLASLKDLRDKGNSVIVVEHDEDAIRTADYLIDMGPMAGVHGGEIVAEGTPAEVLKSKKSLTAAYLRGEVKIAVPKTRRQGNGKKIKLIGATENNLKNIDIEIPLGTFTCITGVSGSGKSTLIVETLLAVLLKEVNRARTSPGAYKKVTGIENIDKVIDIDQSPIGRTPRSNPATYTGMFNNIRDWFAGLPEAKLRGYAPGRFSFNVKGGRCEVCEGDGVIKIEMHFLPDVYVECEACHGARYNRETLEVKYKDKSIADVLNMSVDEAADFFTNVPNIKSKLTLLQDVGMGYIKLGQGATTLSGGEAQRVKLAKELSRRSTGSTLYVLDEPTTGLHFADVHKLLEVLERLVNAGNTVVVIEHNLDVIKSSDYIIDLGPEGGDGGGRIVAEGTPEEVAKVKESYTGQYLKKVLK